MSVINERFQVKVMSFGSAK